MVQPIEKCGARRTQMIDPDRSVGEDLVNGGPAAGRAASEDYRAHRYHQVGDEYNPSWDWAGALQDVRIYYDVGRALASSTEWPNWYPSDAFRAIRDRSRTGR